MVWEELKNKAGSLPMEPGVYIMRDKNDTVIYVGKAKKLKNRVSQYFLDSASHSPKTRLMVSKIDHFDVIVAASEFEALVLECSLIKRHMPKYNILLKDDKGYPYLRLDRKEKYPVITLENKIGDDGAEYFGPYGSRGITQNLLDTILLSLKLPRCSKHFPKDIGKGRPCLHYHMGQCMGWCQKEHAVDEYRSLMDTARQLLLGNFKPVSDEIKTQMLQAAEELNFELAASLRDRLQAVETLSKKQFVTAGSATDTDVIGFAQTESVACFTVLHFGDGNLIDKEYEILEVAEDPEQAVSSLLKHYYFMRGFAPKQILLSYCMEEADLFCQVMHEKYGIKTQIKKPQRGDNVRLVELANKNALEEAERITTKADRIAGSLKLLGKMLSMDPPPRIESYDISNISGTDIVASMVVYKDGKPSKKDYKRFKLEGLAGQDDYASMHQVLTRRFTHYIQEDPGFDEAPDLILIDGGAVHAQTAVDALSCLDLQFPVFGMVKDDRHRTRALVTPEGREVGIDSQQSVFSLIGNIQEQTHNFAISYHRDLRSKRLSYSALDDIRGIGPKRKQMLLQKFKSIKNIKAATVPELERYLPVDAARAVYDHFHSTEEGE